MLILISIIYSPIRDTPIAINNPGEEQKKDLTNFDSITEHLILNKGRNFVKCFRNL